VNNEGIDEDKEDTGKRTRTQEGESGKKVEVVEDSGFV